MVLQLVLELVFESSVLQAADRTMTMTPGAAITAPVTTTIIAVTAVEAATGAGVITTITNPYTRTTTPATAAGAGSTTTEETTSTTTTRTTTGTRVSTTGMSRSTGTDGGDTPPLVASHVIGPPPAETEGASHVTGGAPGLVTVPIRGSTRGR